MTDTPSAPPPSAPPDLSQQHAAHWKGSLRIVRWILVIWFVASLGCGILFRDFLDANLPSVGGAPFGFWMAQQGSIISFVVLLLVYRKLMNALDHKHALEDVV